MNKIAPSKTKLLAITVDCTVFNKPDKGDYHGEISKRRLIPHI